MKHNPDIKTIKRSSYVEDNPTFVIDLDETLWGMAGSYVDEINNMLGTNHSVEDVTQYDICAALNVPVEVFEKALYSDAFCKPVLFDHTLAFLHSIKERKINHLFGLHHNVVPNIALVSLRGFRPDGMAITSELVNRFRMPFDLMSMLPLTMSKLKYADEHFDDVVCIIDDAPKNLIEFYEGGYHAIRAHAHWNNDMSLPNFIDLRRSPVINPI